MNKPATIKIVSKHVRAYVFHSDPAHGWLAVPIAELERLGILTDISAFSYWHGQTAYLEEDCDLAVFATAKLRAGELFEARHSHTNTSHRIRRYASIKAYCPKICPLTK